MNTPTQDLEGPVPCGEYDIPSVLDLLNLVMRILRHVPGQPPTLPTIGFDWSHVYTHANRNNIRIIKDRGKPVSSVAIWPHTIKTSRGDLSIGGINCFATHPDYRGRGLGEAVLLDAHSKMLSNGHHIALLDTSIPDYYRKYGWEYAASSKWFKFDRGNISLLPDPSNLDIHDDWGTYCNQLTDIHNKKPFGAYRTVDFFNMISVRKFDKIFVCQSSNKVLAYTCVRGNSILEHGGNPTTIAALCRHIFSYLDDQNTPTSLSPTKGGRSTITMKVETPHTSSGITEILDNIGIPGQIDYAGMILILDPQSLINALNLQDAFNLCKTEYGWQISHGDQSLNLTLPELTKLFFGPERWPDFAPNVLPINLFQWVGDKV